MAEQEELERSRTFKKGQRFRAGIEGRISVLFRGRGMKRCLFKGRERFEMLVGAAVLANNLMRIADLLDKPKQTAGEPRHKHSADLASQHPNRQVFGWIAIVLQRPFLQPKHAQKRANVPTYN